MSIYSIGSHGLEWNVGLQVGASNELPESEELDALYDRFLIRRQVGQVSDAGLMQLLGSSAVQQAAISSFSTSATDSGSIAFQQQDFANIRWASTNFQYLWVQPWFQLILAVKFC